MQVMKICLVAFFFSLSLSLSSLPVRAFEASFSRASVRLSQTTPSAAPGTILVQIQPSQTVTENQFAITPGSAWSLSSNSANFQVSTANLPNGVTAWPGIGTATSVVGNKVTFPSGDLSLGTTYGFYITGGIASNPSYGIGDNYLWQLSTQNSGSILETSDVSTNLTPGSSSISIDAEVPPSGSYIDLELSTDVITTYVTQNDQITITLTYGNRSTASQDLVLETSWEDGLIAGQSDPTVALAEYISNSASLGYANTTPVIDTENNKITWSINDFPAETTDQTVTFKLQITDAYKESKLVYFDVNAQVLNLDGEIPDSLTLTYLYTPVETTPTTETKRSCNAVCYQDNQCQTGFCKMNINRCRNSSYEDETSCNPPVTEPTKTLSLIQVYLTEITPTSTTIQATTSLETSLTVLAGLSPYNLSPITTSQPGTLHQLKLEDLKPGTRYYYQLVNLDKSFVSDIFTFTTASKPIEFVWLPGSSHIASNNFPLWNSLHKFPTIFISPNQPLTVTQVYSPSETIKSVELIFSTTSLETKILGTTTTRLSEILEGVYTGIIYTPEDYLDYHLYLQTTDYSGNLYLQEIAKLKVTPPITVIDSQTLEPIIGAQIQLEKYNQRLKLYESLSFEQPLTTNKFGHIHQALPEGTYRLAVNLPGYLQSETDFELRPGSEVLYPMVKLVPKTTLLGRINKIVRHISFNVGLLLQPANQILHSSQTLRLLAIVSVSLLGLSSLFIFSSKTGVDLIHIPIFIWHTFKKVVFPGKTKLIYSGTVTGADHKPVSGAELVFYDQHMKPIAKHTTSAKGTFSVESIPEGTEVLITKAGFHPMRTEVVLSHSQNIHLHKATAFWWDFLWFFKRTLLEFLEIGYEFILILSLIGLLLITLNFNWQTSFIFFVFSVINVMAFLTYKTRQILRP